MGQLVLVRRSVLCTHGDVMAELVHFLTEQQVPMRAACNGRRAATWAFEIAGGRIVAGRYLPPPA